MDGDVVARVDPTCHAYLGKARVEKFLWQFKVFSLSPLDRWANIKCSKLLLPLQDNN